jgi:hypothetical protein
LIRVTSLADNVEEVARAPLNRVLTSGLDLFDCENERSPATIPAAFGDGIPPRTAALRGW